MRDDRLILALDGLNLAEATRFTKLLGNDAYALKIHDLFDDEGPDVIQKLKGAGARRVWTDLKFHDIPKTVGRRAQALKKHGADIVTVHAPGGVDMMKAAVDAGLEVYAVTVLTSLDPSQITATYGKSAAEAVAYFAEQAARAQVAGFVCSPKEVGSLNHFEERFLRIVPGTRSAGVEAGDQKRVDTPLNATLAGADKLVMASQVLNDPDPVAAWDRVVREISPGHLAGKA